MAWRQIGDNPLSEPMLIDSLTHIYGTRGDEFYNVGLQLRVKIRKQWHTHLFTCSGTERNKTIYFIWCEYRHMRNAMKSVVCANSIVFKLIWNYSIHTTALSRPVETVSLLERTDRSSQFMTNPAMHQWLPKIIKIIIFIIVKMYFCIWLRTVPLNTQAYPKKCFSVLDLNNQD